MIATKQFFEGVDRIFRSVGGMQEQLGANDEIFLHQMLTILAITSCEDASGEKASKRYHSYAIPLYHKVIATGSLASLQALLLLIVYYQATAQHHLVSTTVGSAVRLAQSLGLHRHARRFKFCAGETEIRKRIWWCVYIFDV
jgi:hypothetical protein